MSLNALAASAAASFAASPTTTPTAAVLTPPLSASPVTVAAPAADPYVTPNRDWLTRPAAAASSLEAFPPGDDKQDLPKTLTVEKTPVAPSTSSASLGQKDGVSGLTRFIPTESISLYVATVSAKSALHDVVHGFAPWMNQRFSYLAYLFITPLLMLILFFRQLAKEGADWRSVRPSKWPWWTMTASVIAFAAWALAIPGTLSPSLSSASTGVLVAFTALVVSTLLNLADPLFNRTPPAGSKS